MFWRDGLINPERNGKGGGGVMEGYRPTCWPMFMTCLPVAYRKVGGLMCLDIDSFAPNIQYSPAHQTRGGGWNLSLGKNTQMVILFIKGFERWASVGHGLVDIHVTKLLSGILK